MFIMRVLCQIIPRLGELTLSGTLQVAMKKEDQKYFVSCPDDSTTDMMEGKLVNGPEVQE